MDTNYYFVQEPNGSDEGPYVLSEIRRRVSIGLLSREATLCRVGETDWLPMDHVRYKALLAAPRRSPHGTGTTPVVNSEPPIVVMQTMPTGFVVPPAQANAYPSSDAAPTNGSTPNPYAPNPYTSNSSAATPPSSANLSSSSNPYTAVNGAIPPPYIPAVAAAPIVTYAPPPPAAPANPRALPETPPPSPAAPLDPYGATTAAAPSTAVRPPFGYLPAPADVPREPDTVAHSAQPAPAPQLQLSALEPQPVLVAAPVALASPTAAWPSKRRLVVGLAAGGVVTLGLAAAALLVTRGSDTVQVKDAMVRVTTASGTGAGFFIDGPDGYAYVATANHVVDRGERILVERDVGSDKHAFVEAYPQTEIVASDPDADLAIIRIKNVQASRFQRLPLAKEPIKDTKILAFGYPGSSLAKHAGLISKDGKILSLASFPAYDQRYARVLRENAVDGLLISADIEPGFSGGPTTNEAGEVVGVNVTKDRAHVGQNGAVSVVALDKLMKTVKPASFRAEPTPADVVKLLEKIQSEYLLLPLEERSMVRETDFVSAADLPSLRRLVGEVRREERNTDTSSFAKYQLSGQAALGMYFARLPGKLLETYRSPNTITPLAACELTNQHLSGFLGDLSTADKRMEQRRASAFQSCDELAVRPLAWDLVAATLQWDGKEKQYTVTKLDRMDEDEQVYRASLRISGASNLIEIWIAIDQHSARLKLFDTTEALYAIKSPRTLPPGALQGTWSMKRPRVTDAINKDAEIESSETLSVSIGEDRKVSLRHVVTERYFGAGNHAKQFRCNRKATIETGLLQSFTGTLENGVVVALPEKTAEPIGADAAYCSPSHKADRIVAVKLQGDQLTLYRTDGNAYPQAVQLTKE